MFCYLLTACRARQKCFLKKSRTNVFVCERHRSRPAVGFKLLIDSCSSDKGTEDNSKDVGCQESDTTLYDVFKKHFQMFWQIAFNAFVRPQRCEQLLMMQTESDCKLLFIHEKTTHGTLINPVKCTDCWIITNAWCAGSRDSFKAHRQTKGNTLCFPL